MCLLSSSLSTYIINVCFFFFFFNDTATTEIYTLSLHDALPIFAAIAARQREIEPQHRAARLALRRALEQGDREPRSEEHTSELQSQSNLVCRLLLEKKNKHQSRARCTTYERTGQPLRADYHVRA